jgi:capsid protein
MATEILQRFKNLIFGLPEQPQAVQPQPKAVAGPYLYGSSGGQKWQGGLSSSGHTTSINHSVTLQNGRSAWHESPQARSLITRRRDITVDKGLPVEPTPAWEVLGITDDKFKEEWVRDHEQRFDMFMSSKQCHRSGTMTGYQIQRLYELFDGRDNDQFVRFFYSRDKRLVSPLQLEFVDPTQIIGTGFTDSNGYQNWNDGILRNDKGEETAYKVRVKKKTATGYEYENVEIPARGARSKRVFMIHGYEQEYAGQGRGYSPLHFAVQNLENIVDLTSSKIKKDINQSGMVGFVKPGENSPASDPHEGHTTAGPLTGGVTSTLNADGEYEFCVSSIPELNNREPGSNFYANLDAGETIEFLKDTSKGVEFDVFVTSVMSYLSAAYNLPIEVVLMKFNANYSASRAALLMAWQIGRIKQDDLKADLMDYIWEMWLSEEIAAGRTQAPGWNDPRLRQAWMRYRLQGPPLPSISPKDDIAAVEKELKFSLNTQERAARERNGSSARQNAVINTKQFGLTPAVPWEDEPEKADNRKPGEGSSDHE